MSRSQASGPTGSEPAAPSDHALEPASVSVVASLDRLRPEPGARALDVAAGSGRHALELARRGFSVLAIDRDASALAELDARARLGGLAIESCQLDLEAAGAPLPAVSFDLVLVVNYLWRPLCAWIRDAVSPGGHLLYETFTRVGHGRPTNPDFLPGPGELRRAFAGFEILASWEGPSGGPRERAHLLARRPLGSGRAGR